MKTQRRNNDRKIKREYESFAREIEIASHVPDIRETSPLLGGSRFHPLFIIEGEEDCRRIATSPPCLF